MNQKISMLEKGFCQSCLIRDDPKLPGHSGEVPIFKWSGWRFNSWGEIFSLLDFKEN
jgi:hypothetical protein